MNLDRWIGVDRIPRVDRGIGIAVICWGLNILCWRWLIYLDLKGNSGA